MQLTSSFILIATLVSAAAAAPTASKRQNVCPLQNLGGMSITASADTSGKVRWDMFTVSSVLIQQGDIAWFNNDQPNGNEIFTATVGSQPNLFSFFRRDAEAVGVSGSKLLASNTPATFKVDCGGCNSFASGNDLAANGCTFELVDEATQNGNGQCITFQAADSVVQLQECQAGNPGQVFGIFSA